MRSLHGHRQTGQQRLSDVSSTRCGVFRCRGSIGILDVWKLFSDRQSSTNVARSLPAVLGLLAKADYVEGNERAPYHDAFAASKIEETLQKQYESHISQTRLPRVERSQSMLYSAQLNSKALKRIVSYIPTSPAKERLAQKVDIALASFKAGVCVSANLSIGQFDSHNQNDPDQMKLIPSF